MFVDKEILLGTMGEFTWFWGADWFIETKLGNFHWRDSTYNDNIENSLTLFGGSYNDFCKHLKIDHGRDKGFSLIQNRCGTNFKLIYPQEKTDG